MAVKIKSRKKRMEEYKEKYSDIANDDFERLENYLGYDFNIDNIMEAKERKQKGIDDIKYSSVEITFYEEPVVTHRGRYNSFTKSIHSPNAKFNLKDVSDFIESLKEDISLIVVPMRIEVKAYFPMPKKLHPVDVILYETENDYSVDIKDVDNIIKAYFDMIRTSIILDDNLVVSTECEKYYSIKPRVHMKIIFPDKVMSKYAYDKITSRKSYKAIKDISEITLHSKLIKKRKKKGDKK